MILLSGCGCRPTASSHQVSLEVWGLFDDSDTMAKVIGEYRKRNPAIKDIQYKKLTVDSYENDLRDALAAGNGPDVFFDSQFLARKTPGQIISGARSNCQLQTDAGHVR